MGWPEKERVICGGLQSIVIEAAPLPDMMSALPDMVAGCARHSCVSGFRRRKILLYINTSLDDTTRWTQNIVKVGVSFGEFR